jgi:hypothetical protein
MSMNMLKGAVVMVAAAMSANAQFQGPSTTAPCYILPASDLPADSVRTVGLLTVGEAAAGYRMVGLPDGMGLWGNTGAASMMVSHEIGSTLGINRAHGSKGAFVSRWNLDPSTKAVTAGRDHNTAASDVRTYDRTAMTWVPGTTTWNRFCSSDLAAPTAYAFNGEEGGTTGRAFAHIVSGTETNTSWELPHLGQCAFENLVASPYPQTKTVVMGLDDSSANTAPSGTPSEVYVYIGNKQASGNDITRAGLVGGTLYGLRVSVGGSVVGGESNAYGLGTSSYVSSGTFELVNLGDASTYGGVAQQSTSIANNVTRFQRVEDGAWDPRPGFENDFYFLTTASFTTNCRLWRVRFTDVTQPELGGTITALLVGNEGHKMLDNMTIDAAGRLLLQEDPGNQAYVARIWMYDTVNGRFFPVATHNPALFTPGAPGFLTQDEESSGILPATDVLGPGWFLLNSQAHYSNPDPELVEGGQLLALYVDPNLGREFALWFTSPSGAGSIAVNHMFGTPNGGVFTAVSLAPGAFPNGWFFGIDIPFSEVVFQANVGAPFVATLDAGGKQTSATYGTGLSGYTLWSVALDNITGVNVRASRPVGFTIP